MNIAFCINRLGLAGLGATVSSLIRNCSDAKRLTLWFFCSGISDNDKKLLEHLLFTERFLGKHHFIDFNPFKIFNAFPSLHGDWTTYGRLLLADYINEETVLYLDADVIVELDVLDVEQFEFNEHELAAVGGGTVKYTLGNKFYIHTIGLNPDMEYFNAGVLLLNLLQWRKKSVREKCFEIAKQNSVHLPSMDQSILNIYCAGNFAKLPASFNCEWLADKPKPTTADKMILHFVGSPKPWDPLGSIIHNGHQSWFKYCDKEWYSSFVKITPAYLGRIWKIRRSYVRCIRSKLVQ